MKKGLHYSQELEFAVLGIILLERHTIARCYGNLEGKHFYFDDHQKIYDSVAKMYEENIPIDLATVHHFMMKNKIELHNANEFGDYTYYLCYITNFVTSDVHLEYHGHILREMWKLRQLENLTHSGIDAMQDNSKTISAIFNQLGEIQGNDFRKEWFDMSEIMIGLLKHQEEIKSKKKVFLSSGFRSVDRINGGFWEGQFVVVGARPSMGKSAIIGKMAMHMAKQGKKVGIISLEMNNNEVAARLGSLESDFDFATLFRALFEDNSQRQRFYETASQMASLPIRVSDKTKVDINEIRAKATKLKKQWGCDCLFVDYLQLIDTEKTNRNYNREQEVSKISRGLKLLAMDLNIPVIAACQLNRESAKRGYKDRFPKESDLRESGSLEQDADAIIMLHRDYKAGFETDPVSNNTTEFEADLLGVKWRNGSTFHLKLDFEPAKMKFTEQKGFIPINYVSQPDMFSESNKNENPF